jgi:hypothetical protein
MCVCGHPAHDHWLGVGRCNAPIPVHWLCGCLKFEAR